LSQEIIKRKNFPGRLQEGIRGTRIFSKKKILLKQIVFGDANIWSDFSRTRTNENWFHRKLFNLWL